MSKKMFSRERGKLRFSALLILIGLLLFGCDPTTVTITYNANGGEGEMKPQAVESGVEVKLIANTFTKDGSDFTGWNEAADGSGKAYADGAAVTLTGNLTLYAQWQEKPAEEPEQPGGEVTDPDEPGGEVTDPDEPGGEVTDPEQPGGEVTDPDQPEDVDLQLTAGTAVFGAEHGLKLPFEVGNTEALTEEKLTELLASVTKTVTLFTANDGTGETVAPEHVSQGVDIQTSTPYILVAAAAFPLESETTYSKIEVVLQAEGYVTQTLTYADVSVNSEPETFGISAGEARYHADTGLTLNLTLTEGWSWPEGLDVTVSVQEEETDTTTAVLNKDANTIVLESSAVTEGSNTYTATLSAFGYTNLQLSWANVEIDKTAPLQILGVSFDRTAEGTSVTANWTLPAGHDIVKVVFTELVGKGDDYQNDNSLNSNDHIKDKENGIVKEFSVTGGETEGVIDGLTPDGNYWFMVHTEDAAGNKSVRADDSVAGTVAPDDNGFMVRFRSFQLQSDQPYVTDATGYFDGTHYIFSWSNPNGYDVQIARKGWAANQKIADQSNGSGEGVVEWIKDGEKKIGAKIKQNPVENSYNFRLMVYATDSDTASTNTQDTPDDFDAFCLFYFPENQANEVTPAN